MHKSGSGSSVRPLSVVVVLALLILAALTTLAAAEREGSSNGIAGAQVPPGPTATPGCVTPRSIRIAVIGDYGACTLSPQLCENEAAVAHFVREVNPDFVITVGDDNYDHGEAGSNRHPPPYGSKASHVGNNNSRAFRIEDFPEPRSTLPPPETPGHFADAAFPPIPPAFPPPPTVSAGVELYERYIDSNRFFISLGNHDWHQPGAAPVKSYFGQEGIDESHPAGLVEVFVVDSNEVSVIGDPDPDIHIEPPPDLEPQASPVAGLIDASAACWKIIYMHAPPYTVGRDSHRDPPSDVHDFIQDVKSKTSQEIDSVLSGHVHALEVVRVPGESTVYITNGKGGASLHYPLKPPELPGVRSYADANEVVWGFVVIDVVEGTHTEPSTATFTWHAVARRAEVAIPTPGGPPTPTPAHWSERWTHWSIQVAVETKTAEQCGGGQDLICDPGDCYSEGFRTLAGVGSCTATPEPNNCGFDDAEVLTPDRFNCDKEDQTIGAWLKVQVCCPPGMTTCGWEPLGQCLMVADAYDCRGNLLGSYCMDHFGGGGGLPGQYEVDTGCVFDQWTTPCRWVVRRNGTSYQIRCGPTKLKVFYYCCEGPECARVYERF